MPVNQMGGIYSDYPQLAAELSFTTVKDYDDWIARLHAIPTAFEQVTANMSIGMEDGRVPPKYLLEKALDQVKELANQKPEDSPLALPLKNFPAAISAAEQERIKTEMLGRHRQGGSCRPTCAWRDSLKVSYVPAGRTKPGIDALPDGTEVLPVPDPAHHHNGPDRRPDSPDRPGRGCKRTKPRCWPSRRSSASRI